jgi:arylsulfatase
LPYFKGEVPKGPREEIYYFSLGGELNAIRVLNWKIHFTTQVGNIATGPLDAWLALARQPPRGSVREGSERGRPRLPALVRRQPVDVRPAQVYIKKFLATISEYPFQEGGNLNAAGINYNTLKAAAALKRLHEMETLAIPAA